MSALTTRASDSCPVCTPSFSGMSFGINMLTPGDDKATGRIGPTGANWVYLDCHGNRFMNEDYFSRQKHGKLWRNGAWVDVDVPDGSFCLMGRDCIDAKTIFSHNNFAPHVNPDTVLTNEAAIAAGIVVKCDTVAELAAEMGVDEAAVQTTLDTYNGFAANNYDAQFYRGQDLNTYGEPIAWPGRENDKVKIAAYDLVPIEAPYYLARIAPVVINSQGGPRRDAQCRVIGLDGNPIPRLYAAGECGCIYPYLYNTGGNVAEAFASGRIAARCASQLEPLA